MYNGSYFNQITTLEFCLLIVNSCIDSALCIVSSLVSSYFYPVSKNEIYLYWKFNLIPMKLFIPLNKLNILLNIEK